MCTINLFLYIFSYTEVDDDKEKNKDKEGKANKENNEAKEQIVQISASFDPNKTQVINLVYCPSVL